MFFFQRKKILAKRRRRRGGYEYYIKWVGYDDSANEWIPEASLNCPERVAEFERVAERKRKPSKKERSSPKKRRRSSTNSNKNRLKKRRVKIIDNYDDDEEDQTEDKPSPSPPPPQPVKSPSSASTNTDKDSNTYGVQKGYEVQAILGINRTKSDQLHYLVHYKSPTDFDDNMELVPSNIAKRYCEDEIIQFYETRIAWNEREHNL